MVSIRAVTKKFGGLFALDNCSFDIAPGSITGLIGPNGAGKSTLFNIVSGFFRPTSGRIFLAGRDITNMRPHQLVKLGLVRTFQIPQEFERMTVLDNLMLVPQAQAGENLITAWCRWGRVRTQEHKIHQRAREVLAFLGLDALRHEFAGNLSGGQKKLLELGRAMLTDARVVLLDEPGAGVNPTLLGKLSDDIRRLNAEHGYTFCIIEHDMDLIAQLCDPVIVMAQGRVLAEGAMEEIRHDPRVLEAYFGGAAQAGGGAA